MTNFGNMPSRELSNFVHALSERMVMGENVRTQSACTCVECTVGSGNTGMW